jgi:hypothetical protein
VRRSRTDAREARHDEGDTEEEHRRRCRTLSSHCRVLVVVVDTGLGIDAPRR